MKKIFLLLFIIPLVSFSVAHKFYLALTEIEFNQEQQSVQIIMSVFMDDIELAINNEFDIDAQISNPNQLQNIDDYFLKYLQHHFKLKVNKQEKNYNFIGKEYDGNIVYFYLEIENISKIQNLEIQNTVLIKNFPDQQNLLKTKINNTHKSLLLSNKNDKGLLNF